MENFNREYSIGELIFKFKTGDISFEEELELNSWLEEDKNNRNLLDKLMLEKIIEKKMVLHKRFQTNSALQKVNQSIDSRKSRRLITNLLKYASFLILPLAGLWFANEYISNNNLSQAELLPGSAKAVLMLSDGSNVELNKKKDESFHCDEKTFAENKNNQLVYTSSNKDKVNGIEETFNTLVTPKQSEYSLSLSDGTKIWMNSSSSLRYPVRFLQKERKVYLTGEAYFEVAKNEGNPFVVVIENGMEVKVLGTKFNVMSYLNEEEVEATLLEGKVEVSTLKEDGSFEKSILIPNQQLSFNKESKKSEVKSVDASIYAAWKDGLFIFENEELNNIMRKLERWYGCMAMYESSDLQEMKFTGEIRKYDDFTSVLKLLELTGDVAISKKGNVIYVKNTAK